MGKRYYFPNQVVEYEGHKLEVTTGGAIYERDANGSLRRLAAVWFGRGHRFQVELLDGKKIYLAVVDRKLVACDVNAAPAEEAAPAAE